jgi:hypothetical protein
MAPTRMTLGLLGICLVATAHRADCQDESAAVPVRYAEGTVHGFLELETATGELLAHGDLLQVPKEREIESRMVFHFLDASVFEESVTFTQHGVFSMQTYHLIQRGPAFSDDLDATLSQSGAYLVKTKSHEDGEEKQDSGKVEMPPDVYNGMVITITKNLIARDSQTVHIVAFTPKPRLIGLEIARSGSQHVKLGKHTETAAHFKLKPKLGTFTKIFAKLMGKLPPDSDVWIVTDGVPAFVRFEGPLYMGPVWRLNLTSPTWP